MVREFNRIEEKMQALKEDPLLKEMFDVQETVKRSQEAAFKANSLNKPDATVDASAVDLTL